MKTIIEGVLAGALPWGLVLSGGGLSVGAMLCGVSPLAFAIGVYLPLATMAAIFVGGCVRALGERASGEGTRARADAGILAASGLVAGEGLAGVLVAGLVAAQLVPRSLAPRLDGVAGELAVVGMLVVVSLFLYRAAAIQVSCCALVSATGLPRASTQRSQRSGDASDDSIVGCGRAAGLRPALWPTRRSETQGENAVVAALRRAALGSRRVGVSDRAARRGNAGGELPAGPPRGTRRSRVDPCRGIR